MYGGFIWLEKYEPHTSTLWFSIEVLFMNLLKVNRNPNTWWYHFWMNGMNDWSSFFFLLLLLLSFVGWTRLSKLKIHLHTETKSGLKRLSCFAVRKRYRTCMNFTGKIIHSRNNYCSNCNYYKRLSKRKLIKSSQSWLSSTSTEKTPICITGTRCQNS